ncbi:MAG: flagellar biosynthesis protein FlhF [Deltaproteobacteria bacterium RBG_13_60_28]|nr:MAG: flagellar biosynthesis protein FlhF [Deltaproteobacteria bacterium RBG_13_60_28]
MKPKTFLAKDLKEALSQVKKELGPEAVILSTQSRNGKESRAGWGGRPGVEVTAALDLSAFPDNGGNGKGEAEFRGDWLPPSLAPASQVQEDLTEVKDLLRQWIRQNGPPSWLSQHKELAIFYRFLTRTGLDERFLKRWLDNVRSMLEQSGDQPLTLKEVAIRYLMHAFEVVDPWNAREGRPRYWTFIGPTGVGKTTTIAKLAARFGLVEKQKVGLISLDNQRLGAHNQLAAYGRITGQPLMVVHQRRELTAALKKMGDLDLVLIDTAGRSPFAPDLQGELTRLLGGLPNLEHHLVLSATTKECNLINAIKRFSVLPIASYVITKLDETDDFSGIFNQLCHRRVPVSYLTAGQQVPEDIELASRRRVTELLLRRRS